MSEKVELLAEFKNDGNDYDTGYDGWLKLLDILLESYQDRFVLGEDLDKSEYFPPIIPPETNRIYEVENEKGKFHALVMRGQDYDYIFQFQVKGKKIYPMPFNGVLSSTMFNFAGVVQMSEEKMREMWQKSLERAVKKDAKWTRTHGCSLCFVQQLIARDKEYPPGLIVPENVADFGLAADEELVMFKNDGELMFPLVCKKIWSYFLLVTKVLADWIMDTKRELFEDIAFPGESPDEPVNIKALLKYVNNHPFRPENKLTVGNLRTYRPGLSMKSGYYPDSLNGVTGYNVMFRYCYENDQWLVDIFIHKRRFKSSIIKNCSKIVKKDFKFSVDLLPTKPYVREIRLLDDMYFKSIYLIIFAYQFKFKEPFYQHPPSKISGCWFQVDGKFSIDDELWVLLIPRKPSHNNLPFYYNPETQVACGINQRCLPSIDC